MSRAQRMKIKTMNNSKLGKPLPGNRMRIDSRISLLQEKGDLAAHIRVWFYGCYGSIFPLYLSFQIGSVCCSYLVPISPLWLEGGTDNLCGRMHFSNMGTLIYRLSYMLFSQCDIDSSQDGGIHVLCLWAWVDFCNCLSQIKCGGSDTVWLLRSWVTKGNSFCLAPFLTCSRSGSLSPLALEGCIVGSPVNMKRLVWLF